MNRTSSIEALIRKSRDTFIDLQRTSDASLHEQTIRDDLKVDIKNIFENLRSCLDYLAHELFEKFCVKRNTPQRLYFPIRHSRIEFDKIMKNDFDFLESIQPYNAPWLGQFNQLNNENKHQDLVEQLREETRHVKVSAPTGGSVSWGGGVSFGNGVKVMGVPIDPQTQLPIKNIQVNTQVNIWVDFKFKDNKQSVLPFVEDSIKKIENIFLELKKYL